MNAESEGVQQVDKAPRRGTNWILSYAEVQSQLHITNSDTAKERYHIYRLESFQEECDMQMPILSLQGHSVIVQFP